MRLIIAFLLSVIVYAVLALAGLWTIAEIYALPPGTSVTDPAMVRAVLSCAPVTAKLLIMAVWTVSSLATCVAAVRWGGSPKMAWVGGLVALGGGVWMLTRTTQPIWMTISAVVIPIVVAALLGSRKLPRRARG
ncbi:MAG TPA: hypothetical protein VGL66_02270 [Caulobacteraceae bacterium]|jgi:hypothetical protein